MRSLRRQLHHRGRKKKKTALQFVVICHCAAAIRGAMDELERLLKVFKLVKCLKELKDLKGKLDKPKKSSILGKRKSP